MKIKTNAYWVIHGSQHFKSVRVYVPIDDVKEIIDEVPPLAEIVARGLYDVVEYEGREFMAVILVEWEWRDVG